MCLFNFYFDIANCILYIGFLCYLLKVKNKTTKSAKCLCLNRFL
jgi:hypothetical protein